MTEIQMFQTKDSLGFRKLRFEICFGFPPRNLHPEISRNFGYFSPGNTLHSSGKDFRDFGPSRLLASARSGQGNSIEFLRGYSDFGF
jgi:hypothetical protein